MNGIVFEFKLPKSRKDLQRFSEAIYCYRSFLDNIYNRTGIICRILKNEKTMND